MVNFFHSGCVQHCALMEIERIPGAQVVRVQEDGILFSFPDEASKEAYLNAYQACLAEVEMSARS